MDKTDNKIIQTLQKDARIPIQRLAKEIHMSSPSVNERVKRLEECGIIKSYHAKIDAEKVGFTVHAFIVVNDSASCRNRINDYIQQNNAIVRAFFSNTSGAELILDVYCRNMNHLDEIQRSLFKMAHTSTFIVSNQAAKDGDIVME